MKQGPEVEAVVDELGKHGAAVVEIVTAGKHGRVVFSRRGVQRFITVSLTGSDRRGPMNARQSVRHMLGVKRGKKVGARRQRREINRPDMPPPPESITPGRDPFAELRTVMALKLPVGRAWDLYFGTLLRERGHQPVSPRFSETTGHICNGRTA